MHVMLTCRHGKEKAVLHCCQILLKYQHFSLFKPTEITPSYRTTWQRCCAGAYAGYNGRVYIGYRVTAALNLFTMHSNKVSAGLSGFAVIVSDRVRLCSLSASLTAPSHASNELLRPQLRAAQQQIVGARARILPRKLVRRDVDRGSFRAHSEFPQLYDFFLMEDQFLSERVVIWSF